MSRTKNVILIIVSFVACILLFYDTVSAQAPAFLHPGLLHSQADLQRMRNGVAQQRSPIYEGYLVFGESLFSHYDYKIKGPLTTVGRNPGIGQSDYDSDANAAYQNALMWAITGDKRHAETAIRIIDAWSNTLKAVTGKDAVLMAGLGPFKMVNAAEIIRHSNAGWPEDAAKRTEKHFRQVIYPVLAEFAPFANGNWDDAALKTVMGIGIFCNDREIFETAVRYYVNGWGNGSLTHYIINDTGQVQETGRDQAHTQLGIGMLAECCEMAWHQGLNLYAYADNRLLKGFEYTAKYNLGYNDIPYTPMPDRTGKYSHMRPSEVARGNLRAVFEQVYNHYVHRMGIEAPFTKAAADKLRPEGPGNPGADHPGYGTLFYSIDPGEGNRHAQNIVIESPAGLVLTATPDASTLSWVGLVDASSYIIKRADKKNGPYLTIGTSTGNFFSDDHVKKGVVYYYTVAGISNGKESAASIPVSLAGGGLPGGWRNSDIGNTGKAGYAQYDGNLLRIEAGGVFTDTLQEAFNYTYRKLLSNEEMIVGVCPQPSSQFTTVGLMIRSGLEPDCPFAALMLYPGKTKEIEAPTWMMQFLQRKAPGTNASVIARELLTPPAVTYGRLTGSYWLKLKRSGNTITGSGSYDGIKWQQLASVEWRADQPVLIGVAAASNISNTTTVRVRLH